MIERLAPQPDELDAAAAEIAYNAGGVCAARQDASRRQFRLFGVANDPDRNPASFLGAHQKLIPVLRPSHGGGCERMDIALFDAANVGKFAKARK